MGSASHRLETIETYDIKWKKYKSNAKVIYMAYAEAGFMGRANMVKHCGKELIFGVDAESVRRLLTANFCRDPLCPLCSWRKSVKRYHELQSYVQTLQDKLDYEYFLHITFTLKNSIEIDGTLSRLWGSWRKLNRRKWFKELFAGYYVSVEYTYNKKEGWHPHLHVLVAFKKGVIEGTCKGTMPFNRVCWFALSDFFSEEWQSITGDSFVVGVKGAKHVHELTKYITKAETFKGAGGSERVIALFEEIQGRRLYAKGGIFRGLKVDFEPDDDLVGPEEIKKLYMTVEVWKWDKDSHSYKIKTVRTEDFFSDKRSRGSGDGAGHGRDDPGGDPGHLPSPVSNFD